VETAFFSDDELNLAKWKGKVKTKKTQGKVGHKSLQG
jgi:hypothetical protein